MIRQSQLRLNCFLAIAIAVATATATSTPLHAEGDDKRVQTVGTALVGVWESVAPSGIDCQTREPLGPAIRSTYAIHAGGTMSEENTDPIEGPYRATGHGIWRHVTGRTYQATFGHYSYDPATREVVVIVKVRTSIRLSASGERFTENGSFEVLDGSGAPLLDPVTHAPIGGCFSAVARRFAF